MLVLYSLMNVTYCQNIYGWTSILQNLFLQDSTYKKNYEYFLTSLWLLCDDSMSNWTKLCEGYTPMIHNLDQHFISCVLYVTKMSFGVRVAVIGVFNYIIWNLYEQMLFKFLSTSEVD